METTLQRIFTERFARYAHGRKLPLRAQRAAQSIMQCRTAALGGHLQMCPDGHISRVQYHSCRHRSCPCCSSLPKVRWAEAQQARLLACDHYHVVFTLPHELLDLWSWNRAWFVDALFQASRDTLMTLLADDRHLGALPGIVMALHTWGRTLNRHPHIHCLVTGGGLRDDGEWQSVERGYLLPVRVMKALYKGKLLARLWDALKADTLALPKDQSRDAVERLLKVVGKKEWNVRLQERYAHGRGVMRYLSRYVKGGPISDRRLISADAKETCFRYTDHTDGKHKVMRLSTDQFLGRVLWHVPEDGQHTIRQYGLYAHQARPKRALCRAQLGQAVEKEKIEPMEWQAFMKQFGHTEYAQCPDCGKALVRGPTLERVRNENSIAKECGSGYVQQGVRLNDPIASTDFGPPTSNGVPLFFSAVGRQSTKRWAV